MPENINNSIEKKGSITSSEASHDATKSTLRQTILKGTCLTALTFQNAAFLQIYKYSRLGRQDNLYIPSTAVCMSETIKVFLSFLLMVIFEKTLQDVRDFFYVCVVKRPSDTLRMCVPAVLYVAMTNLSYISGIHLDVITYQIINQLKIPCTVFFSIIMLRTDFRKLQYLSVLILTIGATVVQSTSIDEYTATETVPREGVSISRMWKPNKTLGVATGIASCILSAFAGVYFERILKSTESTVWSRNVQLSLLSIIPAGVASYAKDWRDINARGFFAGYDRVVWTVILLQVSGGLIVALSVKLASNVSKAYATAVSIVVSGISSTVIFHYRFNYTYLAGVSLVIVSIPMYTMSWGPQKVAPVKLETDGRECYI